MPGKRPCILLVASAVLPLAWPALAGGAHGGGVPGRATTEAQLRVSPEADVQELIEATRAAASSAMTAAGSLGMPSERLTGILSRVDGIEAQARRLQRRPQAGPAQHPAAAGRR